MQSNVQLQLLTMKTTTLAIILFTLALAVVGLRHEQVKFKADWFLDKLNPSSIWGSKSNTPRPSNEFYQPDKQSYQYKRFLKDSGLNQSVNVSLHHIIPGNIIIQTIKKCKEINSGLDMLEILKSFMAKCPKLKTKLLYLKDDGNNLIDTLFSAIFWYKNNLVLGPQGAIRANDPGEKYDLELLKFQSDEYQQAQKAFETWYNKPGKQCLALTQFINLPTLQNVVWNKPQNKKWIALKVGSYKYGSVGYAC